MKNFIFKNAVLVLFVIFSGCTRSKTTDAKPIGVQTISAESLWQRITVDEPYKQYQSWPNYKGLHPGQSPHGRYHKVFVNQTLLSALPITNKPLSTPDGSIIIKENYNSGKQLTSITVMAKVKGYDPKNGNWFWAKFSPKGDKKMGGKLAGCIQCHAAFQNNDYVELYILNRGKM